MEIELGHYAAADHARPLTQRWRLGQSVFEAWPGPCFSQILGNARKLRFRSAFLERGLGATAVKALAIAGHSTWTVAIA